MTKRIALIVEFIETFKTSSETAYEYLDANDWNLYDALDAYVSDRRVYA